MDITIKIDSILNEDQWKTGQWIIQRRSDEEEYGILISQLKNGSWVVVTKVDGEAGNAVKKTTKGWYPAPELINSGKVPPKVKEKIQKKIKQLGFNVMVS